MMQQRARLPRGRGLLSLGGGLLTSRAVWFFVFVNILVLVLYIWSRSGSTTEILIEVTGNRYTATVDGENLLIRSFRGPPQGGIGFLLQQGGRPPTLPEPHGVDWVRVTDLDTGEVLFEDDFGGGASEVWLNPAGAWIVSDGVFTSSSPDVVTTGPRDWTDYVLEAKIRNFNGASIFVRTVDADNAIRLDLDPNIGFRGVKLAQIQSGVAVDELARDRLQLSRTESVRSIVAMLVRPYPTALILLVGLAALVLVVRVPWLEQRLQSMGRALIRSANWLVFGLAISALGFLSYVIYALGQAVPHVPDSVAYVFQAKIFASLRLTVSAPPVAESFWLMNMLPVVDDRWFSQYPFGHPAFLAVGEVFGAMWLVPPMLGAASVGLIYLVGRRLYGAAVGVIGALLLFFSPFFQMTASNFMSHNTAAFVLLGCLFFLTRPSRQHALSMLLSGVFLGVLFNIRPLTAVAFIPVLAIFMGYELVRAGEERRKMIGEYVAFAAGGMALLLAYVLYNLATTGDLLSPPYSVSGTYSSDTFGFGGPHSFARGLYNQQGLLALLLLVANGWPAVIGLSLAALPFVTRTHNRWDCLFAASAIAVAGSYIFYVNAAALYGPRFWYEIMPFLMLLTARGIVSLQRVATETGDWLAARFGRDSLDTAPGVAGAAVFVLIALLITVSSARWIFGVGDSWENIPAVPSDISAIEGYNHADDRLLKRSDELALDNALVLVEPCIHWWCYGSVLWSNTPNLDGSRVWARSRRDSSDLALLEAYSGRDLYLASYTEDSIRPITEEEIAERVSVTSQAIQDEALADFIATRDDAIASHPATPAERDVERRQDLERLSIALEACALETGGYPDSEGQLEVFWTESTFADVCLAEMFLPDLPRDPLGVPERDGYWYLSDGSSFTLVALQELTPSAATNCPIRVRPPSDPQGRYCLVAGPVG